MASVAASSTRTHRGSTSTTPTLTSCGSGRWLSTCRSICTPPSAWTYRTSSRVTKNSSARWAAGESIPDTPCASSSGRSSTVTRRRAVARPHGRGPPLRAVAHGLAMGVAQPPRHRARPRQPVRVRPAQHLHHDERRPDSVPPLLCALLAVGAEHILFATDYPFEEISLATEFLRTAPISEADRAKIAHENAEKLLHLSK